MRNKTEKIDKDKESEMKNKTEEIDNDKESEVKIEYHSLIISKMGAEVQKRTFQKK